MIKTYCHLQQLLHLHPPAVAVLENQRLYQSMRLDLLPSRHLCALGGSAGSVHRFQGSGPLRRTCVYCRPMITLNDGFSAYPQMNAVAETEGNAMKACISSSLCSAIFSDFRCAGSRKHGTVVVVFVVVVFAGGARIIRVSTPWRESSLEV